MDLPGRPRGNADALRAGARAWDHLAWEVWHLTRPVERCLTALLEGWSGPAADAYRARWDQVRRGLGEFDHRAQTAADHLRRLAGHIEDAQSGYDLALGAAGVLTVVGVGLTLVTGGGSDVLAGETDGALAAAVARMVAQFEAASARVMALITEVADLMGALASRFAMEFAIRAPELATGTVGGVGTGIAYSLADGQRDPRDIALGGLVGGLAEGGRLGRRAAGREGEVEVETPRSLGPLAPGDFPRLRGSEFATLTRLQAHPEYANRAFRGSDHVGAEVVDDLGRSYDFLGSSAASRYWNEGEFLGSIKTHLRKSNNFTVVDLAGFEQSHARSVRRFVDALSESDRSHLEAPA